MKLRFLLSIAGWATLMVMAFNVSVASRVRSHGEEILRELPHAREFDYVFLGNSTMDQGLNVAAFAKAARTSPDRLLKLSPGGISAQEECLLLEEAIGRGNRVRRVVIGYHDLHLEGMHLKRWSELTGPFNLAFFADPARAQAVYQFSFLESLKVDTTRWVPLLSRRANLWARVEGFRRELSATGVAETSERTQSLPFYPYLEADRESAHAKMAEVAAAEKGVSDPIRRMLALCNRIGAELIVLEMPLRPDRLALCKSDPRWTAYREYCERSVKKAGGVYIRGFEWSNGKSGFADPVHLGSDGAHDFSVHLAKVLARTPLPASL